MADENPRERAFSDAIEVVAQGDFDAIKAQLEALGFQFRETNDAGHWMYFHPLLRSDPIYRYPRNLYKPHGRRRDTGRVSRRDQQQAKQLISALRAVSAVSDNEEDNQ